jgi:uncharacterized protein
MADEIRVHSLAPQEKILLLTGISRILVRHSEILFAYAYGSFLEDIPFRDLDVAVYLDQNDLPASRFHY